MYILEFLSIIFQIHDDRRYRRSESFLDKQDHCYLNTYIYIYVEIVCGIDRFPYALRHGGVVCRGRLAFENWSKLEVGYPVSSLICKLQEICGIGLARQQRQHPPFYSLVHRACLCMCVSPFLYLFDPLSYSRYFRCYSFYACSFSLKSQIIYPVMHSV